MVVVDVDVVMTVASVDEAGVVCGTKDTRVYPLDLPVSGSMGRIASNINGNGTQWAPYLNRAISKMSTESDVAS